MARDMICTGPQSFVEFEDEISQLLSDYSEIWQELKSWSLFMDYYIIFICLDGENEELNKLWNERLG